MASGPATPEVEQLGDFVRPADAVLAGFATATEAKSAVPVGTAHMYLAIACVRLDVRLTPPGWSASCPQVAALGSSFAARPALRATAFEES